MTVRAKQGVPGVLLGGVSAAALMLAAQAAPAQTQPSVVIGTVTLDAETGQPLAANRVEDAMTRFFELQKQLVFQVMSQVGVDPELLPPDVREQIERPATTSLPALISLSEGLELMDQGRFTEAEAAFAQALELDPGFGLAAALRDAMPSFDMTPGAEQEAEAQVAAEAKEQAEETADESSPASLTTPKNDAGAAAALGAPSEANEDASRTLALATLEVVAGVTDEAQSQEQSEIEREAEQKVPVWPDSTPLCGDSSTTCALASLILSRERWSGGDSQETAESSSSVDVFKNFYVTRRPVDTSDGVTTARLNQYGADGFVELTDDDDSGTSDPYYDGPTITAFREGTTGAENPSLSVPGDDEVPCHVRGAFEPRTSVVFLLGGFQRPGLPVRPVLWLDLLRGRLHADPGRTGRSRPGQRQLRVFRGGRRGFHADREGNR